jgi:O-antigen/teichoic acid export membrane protein
VTERAERPTATGSPPLDLLSTPEAGPAAIRGGTLRIAGYVAGVVLSIVSAALLFRHLGVIDTGRYLTVLAIVAIVGGVSDAGLTAIGVRELSVRSGSARSLLASNLLGLRIVLTVAGLAVAVAFAALAQYGALLVLGTVLAGVGLFFQSVQGTLAISLLSGLRLGWVTVAEFLRQGVLAALIVVLVLVGAGLLPFLAAAIAASLAMLLLTAVLVRRDIPLFPSFDRREWRDLLRDVLPYSLAVAAGVLYFRIAMLLVSLIASESETGFFGASFRVVEALVAVPALMMSVAFPIFARAARDDRERLAYGLSRVFQVGVMAGTGVALCLVLGAPVAIEVVGGADFAPAVEVLRIQAVAVGASFLGAFWGYALLSLRLHRQILFINVLALVLVSALVAGLAAIDGARGAAIGTATAEAVVVCLYPVVLRRSHPELLPSMRFLPRVGLAAAIALAVWLVPIAAILQVVVALIVYVAVLLALRVVPAEVLEQLPTRARRPEA